MYAPSASATSYLSQATKQPSPSPSPDVLPRVVQAQAVYAGIRRPYIAGRYDRH